MGPTLPALFCAWGALLALCQTAVRAESDADWWHGARTAATRHGDAPEVPLSILVDAGASSEEVDLLEEADPVWGGGGGEAGARRGRRRLSAAAKLCPQNEGMPDAAFGWRDLSSLSPGG